MVVFIACCLVRIDAASTNVKVNLQGTPSTPNLYNKLQPKYMSAPLTERHLLHTKLTTNNRRYADIGQTLRAAYTKLRLLTREEEAVAGKCSKVGKQLERAKTALTQKLGRSPTISEWARFCKLTVPQIEQYHNLAESARNRLVQHNIRLVDYWARRLIEHTSGAKDVSYYELVTEGIIGLAKAAEHFDGRDGTPFIKYAQPYVRSELYKGLTNLRPGSFLPHRTVMMGFRAHKAKQRLAELLGRDPTDDEVASTLKMDVRTLRSVLYDTKLKKTIISGQSNLGSSEKSRDKGGAENLATSYFDLFLKADQAHFNLDSLLWKVEFQQTLEECLTATERRTLCLRYGLLDNKCRSVDRTAELMCVSQEGVRQIVVSALEKLRKSPYTSLLEEGPPQAPITTTNGRVGLVSSY